MPVLLEDHGLPLIQLKERRRNSLEKPPAGMVSLETARGARRYIEESAERHLSLLSREFLLATGI